MARQSFRLGRGESFEDRTLPRLPPQELRSGHRHPQELSHEKQSRPPKPPPVAVKSVTRIRLLLATHSDAEST